MSTHIERGFTLIELMITVAIVAILAVIAYPSYQKIVLRSHRADARVALMTASQSLEKCFTIHGDYTNAACTIPSTSENGYYTITAPAAKLTATTYVLKASATGVQVQDSSCSWLAIDQTQAKTAAGADCWNK